MAHMPILHRFVPLFVLCAPLLTLACAEPRPTAESFEQTCEDQLDEASCASVEDAEFGPHDTATCNWVRHVAVSLEGDTCSFGEVTGECRMIRFDGEVGCYGGECGRNQATHWEEVDGEVVLSSSEAIGCAAWVNACELDVDDELSSGPPECACMCDPEFPI